MHLTEALTHSHSLIYKAGEKLLNAHPNDDIDSLVEAYWQQFFAHEHAEACVADKITTDLTLQTSENCTNVATVATFATHEYAYFEQCVQQIRHIKDNSEQKYQLINSLVAKINQHMQQEEMVVFPRLAGQWNATQQQTLVNLYLKELEHQHLQQTVSNLYATS